MLKAAEFGKIGSMHPVLFSLGPVTVTVFGVFLILAVLLATFVIWRTAVLFDQDEERIIDVVLISCAGALAGARAYYILTHPSLFHNLTELLEFFKYPGFSFWGGLILGSISFYLAVKFFKLNFWQIADFAVLGLMLGLSLGSFGCLFSSCQPGLPSSLPFAITQVGLLDKRFPLQLVESLMLFGSFLWLWFQVLKFHFTGKIAGLGLIFLGLIKLCLEPFRGDRQFLITQISTGQIFALLLVVSGFLAYYQLGKRSVRADLKLIRRLLTETDFRNRTVLRSVRRCYNLITERRQRFLRQQKRLFTKINVKSTPPKF